MTVPIQIHRSRNGYTTLLCDHMTDYTTLTSGRVAIRRVAEVVSPLGRLVPAPILFFIIMLIFYRMSYREGTLSAESDLIRTSAELAVSVWEARTQSTSRFGAILLSIPAEGPGYSVTTLPAQIEIAISKSLDHQSDLSSGAHVMFT